MALVFSTDAFLTCTVVTEPQQVDREGKFALMDPNPLQDAAPGRDEEHAR